MPWGQPHTAGTGTTGQCEDAQKALDAVGVPPGPLAIRAITAAGAIARLRADLDEAHLRSIEGRNPGIDMDEVRRTRAAHSQHGSAS